MFQLLIVKKCVIKFRIEIYFDLQTVPLVKNYLVSINLVSRSLVDEDTRSGNDIRLEFVFVTQ